MYNFHRHTMRALSAMLSSAGLSHPSQLEPRFLVHRLSAEKIALYSQMHVFLKPNALLEGSVDSDFYKRIWAMAQAESFSAVS